MSARSTTIVGVVVAVLIIGAVASIGYYQFEVAPLLTSTTSTTTSANAVNCTATPKACVQVTIESGAASPYSGYTPGSTTLYGYEPLTITVVIGVNNTVVWTNNDTAFHTASDPPTFESGCMDGSGVSCTPSVGNSYQFTFTTPGTYTYHCDYHAWMQGKVVVLAGTGSKPTTTGTATT